MHVPDREVGALSRYCAGCSRLWPCPAQYEKLVYRISRKNFLDRVKKIDLWALRDEYSTAELDELEFLWPRLLKLLDSLTDGG